MWIIESWSQFSEGSQLAKVKAQLEKLSLQDSRSSQRRDLDSFRRRSTIMVFNNFRSSYVK